MSTTRVFNAATGKVEDVELNWVSSKEKLWAGRPVGGSIVSDIPPPTPRLPGFKLEPVANPDYKYIARKVD